MVKKTTKPAIIYLVRHGLTDWNEKGLFQGQTDIPLNKKGEEQARAVAKKFLKIKFDAVFSSDLVRAKRTAEIIALEKKIAIKTTKLLRERDFGSFEGRHLKEVLKELKTDIKNLRRTISLKAKELGVESDEEIMIRFLSFLREIAIAWRGKKVLVVTHGSVLRIFLLKLGFVTPEENDLLEIKNLAIIKVKSDGVDFFIEKTWGVEKGGFNQN